MNWIKNFVRPKIRGLLGAKRETPENMWVKCPETGQMVFYRDLENNQFVIPGSGYHMRMAPDVRLKSMFDAGVIVAGLVAGGLVLFTGGSHALARIDSDSAGLIDAKTNDIKQQIAVGSDPGAITVGAGSVWVAAGDGTISRIDSEANLVTQTFPLDKTPSGIAFGDGAVWVATNEDRRVYRISPSTNKVGTGIPVGNGPSGRGGRSTSVGRNQSGQRRGRNPSSWPKRPVATS